MALLTEELAATVTALAGRPLPDDVAAMARRSLTNVCGTAAGAARHDAVRIAVEAVGVDGPCRIPGRCESTDLYAAALATGIAAHVDDFDDTHLRTVIHPAASAFATTLAISESAGGEVDDAALLRAFALGCEVQLRLGNAVSPSHYDLGWHITGTCGVVGCAVTAALAWGLDTDGVRTAIGLACDATLGQREAFGTMTKAWHAGQAAQQGLLAAALARAGQRQGGNDPLVGSGGFMHVLANESRPAELVEHFGERWELLTNTFKPYPCGIVSHPVIDAALAASARIANADDVRAIEIDCHPLVPELMGAMDPRDGLEARFSAAHTAAAALADGELSLDQFDDARVRRDDVGRLRSAVHFRPDASVNRDEATVTVALADGSDIREHVEHARGSLDRPLSDDELRAKVVKLVERTLPGRGPGVWDAGLAVDRPGGFGELTAALVPDMNTGETS